MTDLTAIRQRAKQKAADANGDPSRPGWAEAILARLEAATSGPWAVAYGNDPNHISVKEYSTYEVGRYIAVLDQNEGDREADAAFIAAAREDIPNLLDRIEALERTLVMARTALEDANKWHGYAPLGREAPGIKAFAAMKERRQQALTEIAGVGVTGAGTVGVHP